MLLLLSASLLQLAKPIALATATLMATAYKVNAIAATVSVRTTPYIVL